MTLPKFLHLDFFLKMSLRRLTAALRQSAKLNPGFIELIEKKTLIHKTLVDIQKHMKIENCEQYEESSLSYFRETNYKELRCLLDLKNRYENNLLSNTYLQLILVEFFIGLGQLSIDYNYKTFYDFLGMITDRMISEWNVF